MPISAALFRRSNILLLAAGMGILVAIVAASLWLTAIIGTNFTQVVATRELRGAAADLMSTIQDAETGQRGFLLTRDPAYLEPYERALAVMDQRLAELATDARGHEAVRPAMEQLSGRMRVKLEELARTVALARAGDFDGAVALVREGTGKRLMDEAREDLATLITWSEAALRTAVAAQENAVAWLRWVTGLGAVAILALAGAAAWTIIVYTRDLTEARREVETLNLGLEQRVHERTEALVRANEEIQRFAYIVTHDLRAPLVNIMGFTSELERTFKPIADAMTAGEAATPAQKAEAEQALTEDVPEAIGFIRSSTKKMDGLINAILKISREGNRTLKPETIDLKAMLEAAADAVHHQAEAAGGGVTLDVKAPRLVSDRLSLDQVLGNLLDNAIKYRDPGRPLAITARTRTARGGWLVIEIEDNGRGIAETDHERIFELFRRSGAQNTPGEGIGLAHVRTLVRNLGGDITVRSRLGEGTVFTIMLPPLPAAR